MRASELIAELQRLMAETGTDPEVSVQAGYSKWPSEILTVEMELEPMFLEPGQSLVVIRV